MRGDSAADIRLQLWCVRMCGRILFVTFFIGWVVLARFIPAPSPLMNASALAHRYAHNHAGIVVGATFMMFSFALWAPWGAVIAEWTRRAPGGGPILARIQVVSLTISEMVGVLCAFLWGLAAYRAGRVDPQITQTLNDAAWLMFLMPWPPFSAWCIAVALAVYRDGGEGEERVFPRWTGYMSLLTAFLFVPAGAALYFKHGGYAYNGLLGMYLPLAIFFVWVECLTWAVVPKLKTELAHAVNAATENASPDPVAPSPEIQPAHV
jgi:hypothetical protein